VYQLGDGYITETIFPFFMPSAKPFLLICLLLLAMLSQGQHNDSALYNKVKQIHEDIQWNHQQKLEALQLLHRQCQTQPISQSYAYAYLLHRIGYYKYLQNDLQGALKDTKDAYEINKRSKPSGNDAGAGINAFNIGLYYKAAGDYTTALTYFQAALPYFRVAKDSSRQDLYSTYCQMVGIHLEQGNFEEGKMAALQALLERVDGGKERNVQLGTLNRLAAQAETELGHYAAARHFIEKAKQNLHASGSCAEDNSLRITEALLYMEEGNVVNARAVLQEAYRKAVAKRDDTCKLHVLDMMARFQNHYLHNYKAAEAVYKQMAGLRALRKDVAGLVTLYINLGHNCAQMNQDRQALRWFETAFRLQAHLKDDNLNYSVPACANLVLLPNMQLTFICLRNQAEMLLRCYRSSGQHSLLNASSRYFLLADSLFTYMRQTQTGEESKLYWRKKSRNFYQQALEMCYEQQRPDLAFYYMERSRAVLLNDHLSELNAEQLLSPEVLGREQALKEQLMNCRYRLSQTPISAPDYPLVLQANVQSQERLTRFIRELEKTNPIYYKYKYDDSVPSLIQLKQHLSGTKRQWVQYFLHDTLLFVLQVNGWQAKLHRQVIRNLEDTLRQFLENCGQKEYQNGHHDAFVTASHGIYNRLVGLLHLSPGCVIISPDDAIVPFDALYLDAEGHKPMCRSFMISYAYSARHLFTSENIIKANEGRQAEGNFLGIAPVQFTTSLHLAPLKQSEAALKALKHYYSGAKLLIGEAANSHSFLSQMPNYTVVNLYTHARSNGGDTAEPVIFFQDTSIRLSELQKIKRPITQLAVLSACQTNTGQLASGEGVYSMARGFAMAGVPAIVATLWKADEEAVYFITNEFHKHISKGMAKDSALYLARLAWLDQKSGENQLPFYWANITLMGNPDALRLQPMPPQQSRMGWYLAGAGVLLLFITIGVWRRNMKSSILPESAVL
jgi:CHAT domain-containing protein